MPVAAHIYHILFHYARFAKEVYNAVMANFNASVLEILCDRPICRKSEEINLFKQKCERCLCQTTSELNLLESQHIHALQWPSQSPELNQGEAINLM